MGYLFLNGVNILLMAAGFLFCVWLGCVAFKSLPYSWEKTDGYPLLRTWMCLCLLCVGICVIGFAVYWAYLFVLWFLQEGHFSVLDCLQLSSW